MEPENPTHLLEYIKGFNDFQEYLNKINSNLNQKFELFEGYLVNLEKIEEIKRVINYEQNKTKYKDFLSNTLNIVKKKTYIIEEIEFRNSDYLLNMIFNGNKYIIIDKNLWILLCKENKENIQPIKFEINSSHIKFKLDDPKELIFSKENNYNNLIMSDTFNDNPEFQLYQSNYNDIVNNLYNKMIEYYYFQNEFKTNLQYPSKNECFNDFFVDINWFNEWEEIYDYSKMKSSYLETGKRKEAIDYLIYLKQLNQIKINNLNKPKLYEFNNKNDFSSFIKNNNLVIINKSFFNFSTDLFNKSINYYLYNNKIEIIFNNKETIILDTKDNIIKNKANELNCKNSIEFPNIIQLAKIINFRNLLIKEMRFSNKNDSIILIKKEIINKYISYLKYEKIFKILEKDLGFVDNESFGKKIDEIINNLKINNVQLYEEIKQREQPPSKIDLTEEEYYLKPVYFKYKDKKLLYINDFEIINDDIYYFFLKRKIIQEKQVIKGEYLVIDNKILLCYNLKDSYYFELGINDDKNKRFIIEYIIEEAFQNKAKMIQIFSTTGIDNVLNKIIDDKVSVSQISFHCYNILNKEKEDLSKIKEKNNDNKFKSKIIEMVMNLINLRLFEIELYKKFEESKHKNSSEIYKYLLINQNFLSRIKSNFYYQKLIEFMKNNNINKDIKEKDIILLLESKSANSSYLNILLANKKQYDRLKKDSSELLNINKKSNNKEKKIKFYYPQEFNIIDGNLLIKFLKAFDLKDKDISKKVEEISLAFNKGNIIFINKDKNFYGKNISLLFIYSLNSGQELDTIDFNYKLEVILNFKKTNDLNGIFGKIIKEENILEQLNKNKNNLIDKYGCEIYSMFSEDNKTSDNHQSTETESAMNTERFFNQHIYFAFIFSFQYNNFYDSIESLKKTKEEKIYLINKTYIEEMKYIFGINKIIDIIKEIPDLIKDLKKLDFSKLKNYLNVDILNKFKLITAEDIKQKLNTPKCCDKSAKHLNNNPSNNLFYFDNIEMINQELLTTLKLADNNLDKKCICINGINVIFSDKKVILLINENEKNENYIINVGYIDNNKLKIEYLIQTEYGNNKSDLQIIYNKIKKKGYNNFSNKYINDNQIIIPEKKYSIKAKIYKLLNEENLFGLNPFPNVDISKKLKAMILLAVSQNIDNNLFHENNNKQFEKVYLINYNCLSRNKYPEINSLLEGNDSIAKLIKEFNEPKNKSKSDFFTTILTKLNKEELLKLDKELQEIDLTKENWEAESDLVKLKNKEMNLFQNFIIINENIFNNIKIELSLKESKNNIYYIYKNGDIFLINNNYEYFIVYGNLFKEKHFFDVKYIFDYDKEQYLNEALNIVQENSIDYYMEQRTVFNQEDSNDYISPIFGEEVEQGFCYKFEFEKNYENLPIKNLNNENLTKIFKLYDYYNEFNQRLKDNNNKEQNYYLINKTIMNEIKDEYNYNKIIEIITKSQFKQSDKYQKKKILYILKHLDNEINEDSLNANIKKRDKHLSLPKKNPITISNTPNDTIPIFENFEILDISIASEFFNDINDKSIKKDENCIECLLKEGKIIINYSKMKSKNYKYIYLIGKLDNENTFTSEYMLIYKKDNTHFEEVKKNLISSLNFFSSNITSGMEPIKNKKNEEIGIMIDFNKIDINNIHKVVNENEQNINVINDINQNEIIVDEEEVIDQTNNEGIDQIDNPDEGETNSEIIQKYNLDAQLIQKMSIINTFKMPPLIGLNNIGATCYMNATLQCLCNIPKFVDYFKYNKYLIEYVKTDVLNINNSLSSSFKLLIEQLWPDRYYNILPSYASYGGSLGSNNSYLSKKNESISPDEFKEKISNMNELFKGIAANDAKDLVNFLIMTLHKELNLANNNNLNTDLSNLDQTNQQLIFDIFTKDFVNANKSIISDLFYGVNYNIIQCQGCFTKSYNYQTYFFFIFPLEEIRIFKNQNSLNQNFNNYNNYNINNYNINNYNNININNYNMNNINNFNINNSNEINIYDCFDYERRITNMIGDNAMYCNYCHQTCNSSMCTFIAFGPEIIIIILNRGKGIQYKVKINFVEELNLYNYVDHKETGVIYNLIGVITHLGESDMSGHFIAYCKNPIDNKWYKYNDAVVNEVINFKNEIIDYAMPYVLFYQKTGK